MARGTFPNGPYVSSNAVPADFFSDAAGKKRDLDVQLGMNFLYRLMQRKLQFHRGTGADWASPKAGASAGQAQEANTASVISSSALLAEPVEEESVLALENMVYVENVEGHNLETVSLVSLSFS